MGNKYILRIAAQDQFPELEIKQKQFKQLKESKLILSHALAIEEKYEIIISNFLELEREATNASLSGMVRNYTVYKDFFDVRLALNIRLINLLTTVRSYKDQLSSHICACILNDDDIKTDIEHLLSKECDASFEFRFMEALRNHVQHSGTPVHITSMANRNTGLDDDLLEFSLYFAAQKKELRLNSKFKKSVLNEMPDEVNLKAATRKYIEAISRIHKQARDKIETNIDSAKRNLDKAIGDYKDVYQNQPIGLHAYEYQGEEKIDEISILTEWDDVRIELVKRNGELVNLGKSYVSSQAHNKSSQGT